jgi:hypothetical protein
MHVDVELAHLVSHIQAGPVFVELLVLRQELDTLFLQGVDAPEVDAEELGYDLGVLVAELFLTDDDDRLGPAGSLGVAGDFPTLVAVPSTGVFHRIFRDHLTSTV